MIHNAKVKKRYASMLKREGLAGGGRPGAANDDDGDDTAMQDDDDNENAEVEHEVEMEDAQASLKKMKKGKRPRREPDAMQEDAVPIPPVLKKRKSGELQRDGDEDEAMEVQGPSSQPYMHPDRRPGEGEAQPGPSRSSGNTTPYNNRSSGGREAAEKATPPAKKRMRLSADDLEHKREERKERKKAWAKKSKKGQPDMVSLRPKVDAMRLPIPLLSIT